MPKRTAVEPSATQAVAVATPETDVMVRARELTTIETQADADAAGLFLRQVRQRTRAVKKHLTEVRAAHKQAFDKATEAIRTLLANYEAADKLVSAPVLAWVVAEQERAEAEAKAKLATAREDAERRRQQTVDELKAAAKVATGSDKRLLNEQVKAVTAAPVLPIIEDVAEAAKVEGISVPESWEAEVTDFALLIRAVVDGTVSTRALLPNQDFLDEQAASLERDLRIPGVTPRKVHSLRAQAVR